MSDRPLAELHEWDDGFSVHREDVEVGASREVERELLRVVHERDRLMVIMAGTLKSFAILGLGPGASGEDFTEAVRRAVEHRDEALARVEAGHEHSRDLSGLYAAACDRYRAAEAQRDALGKALLEVYRALHAFPGIAFSDRLSYAALGDALPGALATLRAAGLLPEEEA